MPFSTRVTGGARRLSMDSTLAMQSGLLSGSPRCQ